MTIILRILKMLLASLVVIVFFAAIIASMLKTVGIIMTLFIIFGVVAVIVAIWLLVS